MSNSVDPLSRLIWIYAVCKSLLSSPVAVKELIARILLKMSRDVRKVPLEMYAKSQIKITLRIRAV